jgi:para-nitrobenzyl esterase
MVLRWSSALVALVVVALLAACTSGTPAPDGGTGDPRVRIGQGELLGSADGSTVRFQGIPYAAPPVGERRWAPPDPAPSWPDPRDATRPGPRCPQLEPPLGFPAPTNPAADPGTAEDCLTLAVTAPADAAPSDTTGSGGLPVLVWLHGGGFRGGAGSDYDARRLAAEGHVVVVTVNYRLGVLGFLALPGLPGGGEFGLLDQQAALRWVQREIGAFGGDPGRVTLAGESAGADSVCAQLVSPAAAGLFARAILQSTTCTPANLTDVIVPGAGPGADIWKPGSYLEASAGQLAVAAGCTDPATALACLRAQPVPTIVAAPGYWTPATGTPTVPQRPSLALAAGRWARVPVLIGTTRDEGAGFVADAYRTAPLDAGRYGGLLTRVAGARVGEAALAYPLDGRTPDAAWALVVGDRAYSCPGLAAYGVLSAQVPTFAYEFAEPPALAPHSTELPFLFTVTGGQPEQSAAEQALGTAMRRYWAAFAAGGDPGAGWPAFGPTGPVLTLTASGAQPATAAGFAGTHHCGLWS